jgi:hypothetical protein
MAFISITFNDPINISCDVGDDIYTTPTVSQDSANTLYLGQMNTLIFVGTVFAVLNGDGLDPSSPIQLIVDHGSAPVPNVSSGDFMTFSKNKQANSSGITGYYAEGTWKNNSKIEAELFAVGSSIALSSK